MAHSEPVAYRVRLFGVESICMARSRGRARYCVLRAAEDAGYLTPFFERTSVRRAPEFDACRLAEGRAWSIEHAQRSLATPDAQPTEGVVKP